jgi:hypothetical protein
VLRKAGDSVNDPEMFQTIWKHLKSDGVPDQAANQMTAEMMTHGEDFESSVAKYQDNYDNYKSKGYNTHAAQAMAVESLEEGAEQPGVSTRFANMRG